MDAGPRIPFATLVDRCKASGTHSAQIEQSQVFDDKGGRLLVGLFVICSGSPCNFLPGGRMLAISGLATTFDVRQTYETNASLTTESASLGFRIPVKSEGLDAADHFDTYWGKPHEAARLHACAWLTVLLPCRAATDRRAPHRSRYGSQPRAGPSGLLRYGSDLSGRDSIWAQDNRSHLTGRDPALLPTCVASRARCA